MAVVFQIHTVRGQLVDAVNGDFKIQVSGKQRDSGEAFNKEYSYNAADDFVTVFNADPPVEGGTLDV